MVRQVFQLAAAASVMIGTAVPLRTAVSSTVDSGRSPVGRRPVEIVEKIVPVGEGRMRVLTAGDPSGLPVLLLHGATFRAELWQETGTITALADAGFRPIATDLPGHGKYVKTGYGRDEVMWQLMKALKVSRPAVLGHSLGGAYALSLMAAHPDALSAAILVAPTKTKTYGAKVRGTSLPVLVLWGSRDELIPVTRAAALHALLPNSRLVFLDGARHECYLESPDAFHSAVISFLKSL